MKNITEYIIENTETEYRICKFEYKNDKYKVLIENAENTHQGISHIYPIYKNDDTTITDLDFNTSFLTTQDIEKNKDKNFKFCANLTDEDYKILQKKWPFVKMFKNKSVKIWFPKNIDKTYIEN